MSIFSRGLFSLVPARGAIRNRNLNSKLGYGCQPNTRYIYCQPCLFAQEKKTAITKSKKKKDSQLTTERVIQAAETTGWSAFILLGVGITGAIFYYIGRELFSKNSSNGVYNRTLKMLKKRGDIIEILGRPIKGYGETTRRKRRRYVSHTEYLIGNVKHMQMKFYMEGPNSKADVWLEMKQDEKGNYDYVYLRVDVHRPRQTLVIIDNERSYSPS